MAHIHPTSVVDLGADIDKDVVIGPFVYIGPHVVIGSGCIIEHHASIEGKTTIGKNNHIFPYACIGGLTQDLKYKGDSVGLNIGDSNIFREYVTIHSGTDKDTSTTIGSNNAFLAYSHVAHDCTIGDGIIMSSLSALAGYVQVGNYVNIAWNAGVHQHCKIGDYAMVAGSSKVTMDVCPYMIVEGLPARTRAFNKVNLERHNFSAQEIEAVKNVYRIIFHQSTSRADMVSSLHRLEHEQPHIYGTVLSFLAGSTRGIC